MWAVDIERAFCFSSTRIYGPTVSVWYEEFMNITRIFSWKGDGTTKYAGVLGVYLVVSNQLNWQSYRLRFRVCYWHSSCYCIVSPYNIHVVCYEEPSQPTWHLFNYRSEDYGYIAIDALRLDIYLHFLIVEKNNHIALHLKVQVVCHQWTDNQCRKNQASIIPQSLWLYFYITLCYAC